MARFPKIRIPGRKFKASVQAMREAYPELGQTWGPRNGFYSKAERVWAEKANTMPASRVIPFLRNQGVKQAEIDALDLRRLEQVYGDRPVTPDEIAEYMLNRRPHYTEEVQAGDVDKDELWRQAEEEQHERWNEDLADDADNRYSVEEIEEPTGELDEYGEEITETRYQVYHEGEPYGDPYDDWDDAENDRQDFISSEVQNSDGPYESVDEYVQNNYGSIDDFARIRGIDTTAGGEDTFAAKYGLDPERSAKWMDWHHTNHDVSVLEDISDQSVNLVQKVAPTAKHVSKALHKELTILRREADNIVNDPNLTADQKKEALSQIHKMENARMELSRTTDMPGDWTYSTHWGETENPVQHLRGFYDIKEQPLIRQKPQFRTPEEAYEAGFTYKVNYKEGQYTVDGPTYGDYEIDVYDPEGNLIDTADWGGGLRVQPGGTGADLGYYQRGMGRGDTLEAAADNTVLAAAQKYRDNENGVMRRLQETNPEFSNRRGLLINEAQADLAQQMSGHGKPLRRQPGYLREEDAEAELRAVLPPNKRFVRHHRYAAPEDNQIPLDLDYKATDNTLGSPYRHGSGGRQLYRIYDDPRFREWMRTLPERDRQRVLRLVNEAGQHDLETRQIDPDRVELLFEAGRRAGIPEEQLAVIPKPVEPAYGIETRHEGSFTQAQIARSQAQAYDYAKRDFERGYEKVFQQDLLNQDRSGGFAVDPAEELDRLIGTYKQPYKWQVRNPAYRTPTSALESETAPAYPVNTTDDRYALGAKRALLEAAHTNQDFVAYPYADLQLVSNNGNSAELFPNLYGLYNEGTEGQFGKALRNADPKLRKQRIEPMSLDFPGQEPPGSWTETGINERINQNLPEGAPKRSITPDIETEIGAPGAARKGIRLTEELRKLIKDKGFPFYAIPPWLLAAYGYQEPETRYTFSGDAL